MPTRSDLEWRRRSKYGEAAEQSRRRCGGAVLARNKDKASAVRMATIAVRSAQLYIKHGSGLWRLGRPEDFRRLVSTGRSNSNEINWYVARSSTRKISVTKIIIINVTFIYLFNVTIN